MAAEQLRGLSSMATKDVLDELSVLAAQRLGVSVSFQAAAGVEVAERVRRGAAADLVVLSEAAMSELDADGLFVAGTLRPLFGSDVVAAVHEAAAPAPFDTEGDLRAVLVGARRIAYSTGPSGTAILDLLNRWGLTEVLADRLVQAAPGHPVGRLLADGAADLGFQQGSEMAHVGGIRVLGRLPGAAAVRTTFSGAVSRRSSNADASAAVLRLFNSADAEDVATAGGLHRL